MSDRIPFRVEPVLRNISQLSLSIGAGGFMRKSMTTSNPRL